VGVDATARVLAEGDLLCIFPEGSITPDGTLQEFKGGAMVRPFRRGGFSRVGLNVGAPLVGQDVQPELLRNRVQQLLNT
jgi:1-acyl-sn-glycerol-3-phosphate acyltransferase